MTATSTAYDAIGHTARLTLTGPIRQDAYGIHLIDAHGHRWALDADDQVEIITSRLEAVAS